MITQTWALVVDGYRELSSKKLFWITMFLSLGVVAIFASIGLNERGITVLWFTIESEFNSRLMAPERYYKLLFATLGVPLWLTWIASILALISTAGIIPDFISGGAVELSLSKPISRVRLFLTKYFTGLLFVALQVTAFTLASFVAIGVRGKNWEPELFLAIPIVVCFFSYLYGFCALVGLLTRSAIAALLLTLLFWFLLWGLNGTDEIFIAQRESVAVRIERTQASEERQTKLAKAQLAMLREQDPEGPFAAGAEHPGFADELEAVNPLLAKSRADLRELEEKRRFWTKWAGIIKRVKFVTPKTSETTRLLTRYLVSPDDLQLFMGGGRVNVDAGDRNSQQDMPPMATPEAQQRSMKVLNERPVWWIVGTSLASEAVMVGIACVIFARRDF